MSVNQIKFTKLATDYGTFYRSEAGKLHLRQCLRDCQRTNFKQASLGGEQEQGFEQAFSSLSYAYLKDKAPRLIDYIIGFQLVDRNEDNTKAMGLFGFKVGDQWLYAPVFFLNGDLKGHELLYIKQQDAFVPMKENWVNYLISRKPHVLGEGSPKDTYQLGGLPPDIYRLTRPPTSSKYGSARPEIADWAKPFLAFVGAVATKSDKVFQKHAGLEQQLDLGQFLRQDFGLLQGAFETTRRYPILKSAFDKFYGQDFFAKVAEQFRIESKSIMPSMRAGHFDRNAKKSKRRRKKMSADSLIPEWEVLPEKDALEVITNDDTIQENMPDLTEEERERLLRDTVLIKDKRDPHSTSMVYNTQVKMELTNPSETGVYDLLERPGSFDEMLVIAHPQTNRGREQFSTIVRLSDPRNWLNIHQSNVWVKPNAKPDRPDFTKWYDGIEKATLEKGGYYLAIGPNGAGTTPFRVRQVYEDGVYEVEFKDYCAYGKDKPTWLRRDSYEHGIDPMWDYDCSTYDAKMFINKHDGTGLRSIGGELSIPQNFKFLKLQDPPPPPKKDDPDSLLHGCGCESPVDGPREGHSEKRPIQPGDLLDIQLMINEKTAAIRILDHGSEVWIKARGKTDELMSKKAALISLVRDHGCTEFDARYMLKAATSKNAMTFRIKYAEPNSSVLEGGPGMPAFPPPLYGMESVGPNAYPAMYPQEEFQQIPELNASNTDPTIYDPFYMPDQQAMQVAQEASRSGQKEVFDTATISGMLKAVRQDSLVDRYLGALMKALDKLGRILFMFYWHQEEFEDRYGKQDLPELEDSLRNAFETLGDVVLFLQEKRVGDISQLTGGAGSAEPDIQEAARN